MNNPLNSVVSGLWAIAEGLWTTLKNVFRKPVTVQYGYAPRWSRQETRPVAPRYRGKFVLVRDAESGELRCTGCKLCAQACPGRCIEVTGENRKVASYTLDLTKCLYCGMCVEACPFEALGMEQLGVTPLRDRADLVWDLTVLAQPVGAPMPGMLPSTAGGDLRPGKKPFVPKPTKATEE